MLTHGAVPPSESVSFVTQLTLTCEAALRKVCDHAECFYRNVNCISTSRGLTGGQVCLEGFFFNSKLFDSHALSTFSAAWTLLYRYRLFFKSRENYSF